MLPIKYKKNLDQTELMVQQVLIQLHRYKSDTTTTTPNSLDMPTVLRFLVFILTKNGMFFTLFFGLICSHSLFHFS
jgi:hypothetical protein